VELKEEGEQMEEVQSVGEVQEQELEAWATVKDTPPKDNPLVKSWSTFSPAGAGERQQPLYFFFSFFHYQAFC